MPAALASGKAVSRNDRVELIDQFITPVQSNTAADNQLPQNRVEFGLSFAASESGNIAAYTKSLLTTITSDPASVENAKSESTTLDNPLTPTPTPTLDRLTAGFVFGSLKFVSVATGGITMFWSSSTAIFTPETYTASVEFNYVPIPIPIPICL